MPGTRSCCLVGVSGRYDNRIRSEYRDERGFHARSGKFRTRYHFRTRGSIRGSDSRGAGTRRTLRQAAISLKKANPQARYAGSTRRSGKNNPQVMTRPDPRDFNKLLTRPDPTLEILKPLDPTRPDPRDFEAAIDPTRPDPRDFENS